MEATVFMTANDSTADSLLPDGMLDANLRQPNLETCL